jgi:hypothetical protein
LNRALVDFSRDGLEGNAGVGKKRLPRSALRRQDQGFRSAPDCHSNNRWR